MNTFEINKIVGAFLLASLTATSLGMISRILVSPKAFTGHGAVVATAGATKQEAAPPAVLEPIVPLLAAAPLDTGEKLAKQCLQCHTFDKAPTKKTIGPNLWNVVGGKRAGSAGFKYSPAMVNAGGDWGYDELNAFLANPKAAVKGTAMTFAGMKKPEERAAVVAFLRSLSDSPKPLP